MAVILKVMIDAKQAEIVETTQYVCPVDTAAILDLFTGTNPTGAAATITIRIVKSGGSPGAANTISSAQSIAAGAAYTFPELAGHIMAAGDFISTLCSAAAITIRASGREVT